MFLAVAFAAMLSASTAECASLPDVAGWSSGELRETKLEAISGSKGMWHERTYRTNDGTKIKAVLMEGSGAKLWKQNLKIEDKGEISGGESAAKLKIADCDAIIEYRPVLGRSLIVKISNDAVLTLESESAGERELASAAETLIESIRNK